MREEFSLYDVGCACLALLPFVAFSVLLALVIIPPVSADTLVIYPDTDETVYNGTEATTSVIRNAPGEANYPVGSDTLGDSIAAWSSSSPNVDHLFRPIAIYNTSAIGSGTISSVTQSVFSESVTTGLGNPNFSITGGTPASYTSIAISDYNKFASTEFITGTAYGSFPTWSYADFAFNAAGRAYINKTGHTVLYYRNSWDTQNDYTGYTWASGAETYLGIDSKDHPESSRRPYLTIEYTPAAADTTPPQSLSTFANTTNCSQTNISFTKPTDSDYDGFKVWWNNAAETNITNSSTWYNKSGLTALTSYTLSTKTFDLVGNLNATFTNYTVTTTACADTTPPASITSLTNTSVTCSQLFFNWTNPPDSDYDGLMVWRNNTALTNLSNTTTGVSWTGLPELTDITFSSKTFDITGNVNASFVNMTRTTGACGVAPVAAFSANDTTVCTVDWIQFTDSSSNTPTSWNWSFGDGNVTTTQTPVKNYNITGTYTVNLTVANAYGFDSEVKTNYITVSACAIPTPAPTPTPVIEDWEACFPWCGIQELFFWNASSDVSGYKILDHIPEKSIQHEVNVTISAATGSLQLGAWVSPDGTPGVTTIAPGMWRFRTYHNVSSQVGITTLEFHIINRSSTGTETDLFYGNAITRDINTLDPTEQLLSYARRNVTTMFSGDRLVIKVNASTTSVTSRKVYMWLGGNTNTSMVQASNFICCEGGGCNTGSEGIAILFGVVGGILGAIAILRRRGEAP